MEGSLTRNGVRVYVYLHATQLLRKLQTLDLSEFGFLHITSHEILKVVLSSYPKYLPVMKISPASLLCCAIPQLYY